MVEDREISNKTLRVLIPLIEQVLINYLFQSAPKVVLRRHPGN